MAASLKATTGTTYTRSLNDERWLNWSRTDQFEYLTFYSQHHSDGQPTGHTNTGHLESVAEFDIPTSRELHCEIVHIVH